jgi:hypothetical protein
VREGYFSKGFDDNFLEDNKENSIRFLQSINHFRLFLMEHFNLYESDDLKLSPGGRKFDIIYLTFVGKK